MVEFLNKTRILMGGRDNTEWYQEWFDEDYLALYSHRDATEARRFVSILWAALELRPGIHVADVPCGAGRHSLAFAERGAHVTGVDLSAMMLRRAAEAAADLNVDPCFVRGDLRRIPLAGHFQVVANIFSSIGYFDKDTDNKAAFRELARILAPGGVLILDVINPSYLRDHFVPETRRDTADSQVRECRELDPDENRVSKRIEIRRGHEVRWIRESVRLYNRSQLEQLAEESGLTPVGCWGDYNGRTFEAESPRLILFAEK